MEQHFIRLNLEPILHEDVFVAVWVTVDPDGIYWELAGAETPELKALQSMIAQVFSRQMKEIIISHLSREYEQEQRYEYLMRAIA